MPFISVTRLRIRSLRFLLPFANDFIRTRRQLSSSPGFRGGSLLADRAWTFWTMTAWDHQQSMQSYMTKGAHREAMPHLLEWCDEASTVHWESTEKVLPSWRDADQRMRDGGRPSKVLNPSPQHASLNYQVPRFLFAGSIRRNDPSS